MSKHVFLFCGADAAEHCHQMMVRWEGLLPEDDWRQCGFLLLGDVQFPAPTKQLARRIEERLLRADNLQSTAAVVNMLRQLEGKGHVLFHCICNELAVPPEALLQFVQACSADSVNGFYAQFYLFIQRNRTHGETNRQLLEAIEASALTDPSVYLLADHTRYDQEVSDAHRWDALSCELALHVMDKRRLFARYNTLGYGVVNAESQELNNLCAQLITDRVMIPWLDSLPSDGDAAWTWEQLFSSIPMPTDPALRKSQLRQWLDQQTGRYAFTPTKEEKQNNRILCAHTETSLDQRGLMEGIRRFYSENSNHRQITTDCNAHVARCQQELRHRLQAVTLSGSLIKDVCRLLKEISHTQIPFRPQLPKKRLFEREKRYRDRLCAAIEAAADTHARQQIACTLAGQLADAFAVLQHTATALRGNVGTIRRKLSIRNLAQLQEKYPKYADAMAGNVAMLAVHLRQSALERKDTLLFNEQYQWLPNTMDHTIDRMIRKIQEVHGHGQRKTLHQVLDDEYATKEGIAQFISRYTSDVSPMYLTTDTPRAAERMMLVDHAFQDIQWDKREQVVFCRNDNIELLDLYAYDATGADIVGKLDQVTHYYRPADAAASEEGGFRPVRLGEEPAPEAGLDEQAFEDNRQWDASVPAEDLGIRMDQDGEIMTLKWDWAHYDSIIVQITHQGREVLPIISVNKTNYYHGLPLSDMISNIPQGELTVTIEAGGKNYRKTVCGRQRILRYSLRKAAGGSCDLIIHKADLTELEEVVFTTAPTQGGRQVKYPVRCIADGKYPGLVFSGEGKLQVKSDLSFPHVQVKKV